MTNVNANFSESGSAGKFILWLLLIAAFIIILILYTLLTGDDTKEIKITEKTAEQVVQEITPELFVSPQMLNWANTEVGQTKKQKFVITANSPIIISDVKLLNKENIDISEPITDCVNMGQINRDLSCSITIEFTPLEIIDIQGLPLSIEWRGINQPERLTQTKTIAMSVGAFAPVKEEPIVIQNIIEQPDFKPEFVMPEFKYEVETAQLPVVEDEIDMFIPQALPTITPVIEPEPIVEEVISTDIFEQPIFQTPQVFEPVIEQAPVESCSDFSFYGYNSYGAEIGWIKPVAGAYKFYPFSDTGCENPTGRYNPDNGIISDINDASIQIGTDAENVGLTTIRNSVIPQLSAAPGSKTTSRANSATTAVAAISGSGKLDNLIHREENAKLLPSSYGEQATVNSMPYDRTFVLRQYKPIPATIVTEIRAVANETQLPVTATVDRNVYSDDGRTIIVPAGTMMLGSVKGDMPGPYKSVGRVNIEWYRFVRPDGVEFNFTGQNKPFSGDAQGRTGVLGRGSTDYVEQMVMPMLTAVVPAAVNLIAPISDSFINQIDLDSNTVTQSGQLRSSELAKNEIITAWNQVAQKILTDMIDDSVPPFTIGAGTRITVFSPDDLILTCGAPESGDKKCSIVKYNEAYSPTIARNFTVGKDEPQTLIGQARSFNTLDNYCDGNGGVIETKVAEISEEGLDYRTVLFYCQSFSENGLYQSMTEVQQEAIYQNQNQGIIGSGGSTLQKGTQSYNEEVLGLEYANDGTILNPFDKNSNPEPAVPTITCPDGTNPDGNGCCTGETYTDMGEQGFNCCPAGGGDCFPPIL